MTQNRVLTVRAPAMTARVQPLERVEQSTFFQWLHYFTYDGHKVFDYAYAIPNGSFLAGDARRRAIQANALKMQGLKPGYPDVNIDLPANGYHGLRIEMKRVKGDAPGEEQVKWHGRLRGVGFDVRVCYGWEEAKRATLDYFTRQGS